MSNFSLHFLEKENDLNKVLRSQKKNKNLAYILFLSLWDEWSSALVGKLKDKYTSNTEGTPVYIVDSFKMPHAFVIFKSSKLPHLVKLNKDKTFSVDYLPDVYRSLSI